MTDKLLSAMLGALFIVVLLCFAVLVFIASLVFDILAALRMKFRIPFKKLW
jgi:hypothetical protein